jgi:hypothetical protein
MPRKIVPVQAQPQVQSVQALQDPPWVAQDLGKLRLLALGLSVALASCGGGGSGGASSAASTSGTNSSTAAVATAAPAPAVVPESSSPAPAPAPAPAQGGVTPAPTPACMLRSGCGGTSASDRNPSTSALSSTFPVGLAVGSPGDVSTGSGGAIALSIPEAIPSGLRLTRDWLSALWTAVKNADGQQVLRLAGLAAPVGSAYATPAPAGTPEMVEAAVLVEAVLSGDGTVPIATLVKLDALFDSGGSASCYGPQVLYQNHDDGPDASPAQLPGGDVGMWLSEEEVGRPCAVAQLGKRVRGAKRQGMQGLLMAGIMRRAVASDASLSMPTAGASVDVKTQMSTLLATVPSFPATVEVATIALDSASAVYTYRLVLKGTGPSAKVGEMLLRHTPGASASAYTGVLQVSAFSLEGDPNFGCSDEMSGGQYKVARVSTLRYDRAADAMSFSSRSSHYCGHANFAVAGTNYGAEVASFTGGYELDPTVKATMPPPATPVSRGAVNGWRGDFNRYAADYDRTTAEGSFFLAWQAGVGDSHSRTLAVTKTMNSVTKERTIKGYFGYGDEISLAGSAIDMKGMICNWAGPGGTHTPNTKFQSQEATRAAGATAWTLVNSKITYAPTNSCDTKSGSTMNFDVDAGVSPPTGLTAGEGLPTVNNLDTLTGSRTTVKDELASRGWVKPSMF